MGCIWFMLRVQLCWADRYVHVLNSEPGRPAPCNVMCNWALTHCVCVCVCHFSLRREVMRPETQRWRNTDQQMNCDNSVSCDRCYQHAANVSRFQSTPLIKITGPLTYTALCKTSLALTILLLNRMALSIAHAFAKAADHAKLLMLKQTPSKTRLDSAPT